MGPRLPKRVSLEHGMRYEDAARRLHLHPNTLRHRLHRFELVTGGSLRDMSTLAEPWWALACSGDERSYYLRPKSRFRSCCRLVGPP
ncbi:helix-turn-helix domain-containing protein [Nocardia sp. NPDC004604]|uniref:helix-turn-helix domain-containing protein n=1 Tax=Nocardia sp. NPDC004604 TaxID=3157013 RepID=UPI0033B86E76